jgi:hypothetical protein
MKAIYRDLMVGFAVLAMQNYALALTPEEPTRALYIKLANSVMPNGNQLKIGRSYFIIANPGVIVGKPEDLGGELRLAAILRRAPCELEMIAFLDCKKNIAGSCRKFRMSDAQSMPMIERRAMNDTLNASLDNDCTTRSTFGLR